MPTTSCRSKVPFIGRGSPSSRVLQVNCASALAPSGRSSARGDAFDWDNAYDWDTAQGGAIAVDMEGGGRVLFDIFFEGVSAGSRAGRARPGQACPSRVRAKLGRIRSFLARHRPSSARARLHLAPLFANVCQESAVWGPSRAGDKPRPT